MFNENKHEEGHNHGNHCCMTEMTDGCHKEFMIAKLEKKEAILKIELEFIGKIKKMLMEKTEKTEEK